MVIADQQRCGRGRQGRSWYSPAEENLYFSVVLRPPLLPRQAPPIALVAAVATADAIAALGVAPDLKWPNDVLLEGRKVAGILTEMATTREAIDFVVVGVGVDLNNLQFPPELVDRATSVRRVLGHPVNRSDFAAELCARLEYWYDRLVVEGPAPLAAAWKKRSRLLGRTVTVDGGREQIRGVAEDLDDEGALLLRTEEGRLLKVLAGEII